jgi:hypothetical protein
MAKSANVPGCPTIAALAAYGGCVGAQGVGLGGAARSAADRRDRVALVLGALVASLTGEPGGRKKELPLSDVSGAPARRLFVRLEVVLKGRLEVTVREGTVHDVRQRLHARTGELRTGVAARRAGAGGRGRARGRVCARGAGAAGCTKAARGLRPVWNKGKVLEFELSGHDGRGCCCRT